MTEIFFLHNWLSEIGTHLALYMPQRIALSPQGQRLARATLPKNLTKVYGLSDLAHLAHPLLQRIALSWARHNLARGSQQKYLTKVLGLSETTLA